MGMGSRRVADLPFLTAGMWQKSCFQTVQAESLPDLITFKAIREWGPQAVSRLKAPLLSQRQRCLWVLSARAPKRIHSGRLSPKLPLAGLVNMAIGLRSGLTQQKGSFC